MQKQSLFRKLTNKALGSIELNGAVVDLGGDRNSDYTRLFKGAYTITTVNINPAARPNVIADLEKAPLPLKDGAYDTVLLINVLEHIYHHRELLEESHRILKDGGEIVAVVPFLYYIHSSPNDYFRYSKQALERMLKEAGFKDVEIRELGTGAFGSAYNLIHRFIPTPFHLLVERGAVLKDWLFKRLAQMLGKKYTGEEYPLGYLVVARKRSH